MSDPAMQELDLAMTRERFRPTLVRMPHSLGTGRLPLTCALALLAVACSDSNDPPSEEAGSGGSSGGSSGGGSHAGSAGSGGRSIQSTGGAGSGTAGTSGGRSGAGATGGRSGAGTGGGTGSAGSFVPPASCTADAECDDDNPCTDQECEGGECQYTDNTATCDDGDTCTGSDRCDGGTCAGTAICGDECSMACPEPEPVLTPVATGYAHTCARKDDGTIRCWGDNFSHELGYPEGSPLGGDVEVGGSVLQLALASTHSCAVLEGGALRCWGSPNGLGLLGYGSTETIGDDPGETPASAGDVDLGGAAVHIDTAFEHMCAALADGKVRCWGEGGTKLGYGDGDGGDVGSTQTPAERGDVDVGGRAVQVAAGGSHSCALLDDGTVRCWGGSLFLGTKAAFSIGLDDPPSSGPVVALGGKATQITAGDGFTCALLEDKTVRCWGVTGAGQLGYGDLEGVGDDETPAEKGPVDVGGPVIQISAGEAHVCAVLEDHSVRCWGRGEGGRLGYGNEDDVGYEQTPGSLPNPVDVGGDAEYVSAGGSHTCAVLTSGAIRCWGQYEALGYPGVTEDIGDDETPASAGDVPWLE